LKSDFADGSVRFFAQPLIKRALSVMANSKQDAEGIPDMRQPAIDYILHRNKCICGSDLEFNEGAKNHIKYVRALLPPETIGTTIRDMRTILEQYQINPDEFGSKIKNDHIAYASNLNYIDDKQTVLDDISKSINEKSSFDVKRIESDYIENNRLLNEKNKDYERFISEIGEKDGEIKRLKIEQDQLISSTTKTSVFRIMYSGLRKFSNGLTVNTKRKKRRLRSNFSKA
jgi:DNA sulfur modification protein DndD